MTELQHLEQRLKLSKERLNSAMAAMETFMDLNQRQLEAAHQLGEAILRFAKTFEAPKQNVVCTIAPVKSIEKPPEKMKDQIENRLLKVSEVAELLSLGRTMIYELMYSGRLPSVKIGNARRFKLNEVMKLFDGID